MSGFRATVSALAAGLVLTVLSCSKAPTGGDNTSITTAEWAYPMKVGNRWSYERIISFTDSAGTVIDADTQHVVTTVPRTDLLNGVPVFVVKDSADTSTESYVELRTDGLYLRGMTPGAFISLCKSSFQQSIDLSALIYDQPRFLFPVNVTAGLSWTLDTIIETFDSTISNDTTLISRQFLGEESVATGMGNLVCRKFRTMYPGSETVDYVSTSGLTKRSIEIDSFPYAIINASSYSQSILTTYREELVLSSAALR